MFEPKVYKRNGLETFRLLGSDGSEFFYEGAIDCNENEIYRDEQGRLYFPVVTEIGGVVKYFVELDLNFPPIPLDTAGDREKEISRLINASPRRSRQLPEGVFVMTERETGASDDVMLPQPSPSDVAAPTMPDTESASDAATEVAVKPAGKLNVREPSNQDEPPVRRKKSGSLALPVAAGLIVLVLIAAVTGVYILKPGMISGLTSIYTKPTPTPTLVPSPTLEPTVEPVITATPEPTPDPTPEPESISTGTLVEIQPLIDSDNVSVTTFVTGHVAGNSAGNKIRQSYDLYTFVNGNDRWTEGNRTSESSTASVLTQTLTGDSRDYSVLMCALTTSLGVDSRVIAYYKGDTLYYYPEILVANSSEGYTAAKADLKAWFGVTQPFGHTDETGYWLSLTRGTAPGTRVEASEEYAIYVTGPPVKIK